MGRTVCTEPQYLYKGALYLYLTVELYLYSPYGPYGLYRTSVPVQSLSARTRVHFTFTLRRWMRTGMGWTFRKFCKWEVRVRKPVYSLNFSSK